MASGVVRATPDQVSGEAGQAFGGPVEEAVPVIVLNGKACRGSARPYSSGSLPDGLRIVISQNPSDFDHPETLIVVSSPDDVGLAERVRDLLGVGSVSESVVRVSLP